MEVVCHGFSPIAKHGYNKQTDFFLQSYKNDIRTNFLTYCKFSCDSIKSYMNSMFKVGWITNVRFVIIVCSTFRAFDLSF